ncbi:putative Something about silencing protein 10 [Hypsibius exemplaris]|uniref:Something about silencing protein 10 n=1 Tax=Hypsibius exemplaris TaxID=2072580 RepID=A0A1W0WIY9_HYPEX|nr:putative Something about silencing protein 10 [Hypsibius exemplaris]
MGKFARANQKELRNDAKRSARKPRTKSAIHQAVDEDAVNQVDSGAAEFMHDEAGQYHHNKRKALERGFDEADEDESGSEEEVMPVGGDTTDEDSSEGDDQGEDGEDDDLPNRSAWGSKRANFYHTDFVDKDHGRFQGSDAEEAEEEEREAKELQAKLTKELTSDDFGFGEAMDTLPPASEAQTELGAFADVEKMSVDISKLSEFEKMERIKEESPELLGLISDCLKKMSDLVGIVHPLLTAVAATDVPILTERAELYLRTKHQLILGYCQNVNFYMSLKAKRVSVENHPVTRRLLEFRRFLLKLDPLDRLYERPIAAAMAVVKQKTDLKQLLRAAESGPRKGRVTFGSTAKTSDGLEVATKDPSMSQRVKEPVPAKKSAKKPSSDSDASDDDQDEAADEDEPRAKRKVTYQIEKNKGTTPYRKKEYRNPRVKHRMKYRKAQISRKGQVQLHRPEMKKYAGEHTGIRAGVIRSIKFK